jgi:hypothetical protein
MRGALSDAQTLKTLWVTPHLAPLLGQGADLTCDLLGPRHADVKPLLGFLPSGKTASGRQAKGEASRLLGLAYPVLLGHPEKRCDGIGADRQANLVETEGLGGLELIRARGCKLAAPRLRGDGVAQRRPLGQRIMREALGFEPLLARQQRQGIVSKPFAQGVARGEGVETGTPEACV